MFYKYDIMYIFSVNVFDIWFCFKGGRMGYFYLLDLFRIFWYNNFSYKIVIKEKNEIFSF